MYTEWGLVAFLLFFRLLGYPGKRQTRDWMNTQEALGFPKLRRTQTGTCVSFVVLLLQATESS